MIFMAISSHQLIDLEWFCGGSLKHMCGTEAWTMAFSMIIQILWISPHLRGFPCQQGTMRNTVCLAFANKGRDTESEEMHPRHPKTWIATAILLFTGRVVWRYHEISLKLIPWEIQAPKVHPSAAKEHLCQAMYGSQHFGAQDDLGCHWGWDETRDDWQAIGSSEHRAPKKFSELEKNNATWLVTPHYFPHFSTIYPDSIPKMIYACLNPQNKVLIFNLYKIVWPPKSIHSCWKLLAARMNSSRWARGFQAESCEQHSWTGRPMGLSENKVPLNPLVNQC